MAGPTDLGTGHLLADVVDPSGDDRGPEGRYRYPSDPAFAEQRPNDIERVTGHRSGSSLRIELALHQLLSTWNPPRGFDHVAFNIHVELPPTTAGEELASLPPAHRSIDAAATRRVGRRQALALPRARQRLVGRAVQRCGRHGRPGRHAGDPDGGHRDLGAEAGPCSYGGGKPAQPRVMDDVLIRLP